MTINFEPWAHDANLMEHTEWKGGPEAFGFIRSASGRRRCIQLRIFVWLVNGTPESRECCHSRLVRCGDLFRLRHCRLIGREHELLDAPSAPRLFRGFQPRVGATQSTRFVRMAVHRFGPMSRPLNLEL